jgi:hypothetical protein
MVTAFILRGPVATAISSGRRDTQQIAPVDRGEIHGFNSTTSEAAPQTQDCKTQDARRKLDLTKTNSSAQESRLPIGRHHAALTGAFDLSDGLEQLAVGVGIAEEQFAAAVEQGFQRGDGGGENLVQGAGLEVVVVLAEAIQRLAGKQAGEEVDGGPPEGGGDFAAGVVGAHLAVSQQPLRAEPVREGGGLSGLHKLEQGRRAGAPIRVAVAQPVLTGKAQEVVEGGGEAVGVGEQDAQADDAEGIQVAGCAEARQQVELDAVRGEGALAAVEPFLQFRRQFGLQR